MYTNDPRNSPTDQVRFIVGDTDNTDLVLSNEEIEYLLDTYNSPRRAAVYACEAIMAFYARQVDSEIDQIRIIASDRFDHYSKLSLRLRREAGLLMAVPYAGGILKLEREQDRKNKSLIQPIFTTGMQENRRTS
jgi:hypothetical protein